MGERIRHIERFGSVELRLATLHVGRSGWFEYLRLYVYVLFSAHVECTFFALLEAKAFPSYSVHGHLNHAGSESVHRHIHSKSFLSTSIRYLILQTYDSVGDFPDTDILY
jgi:hypothetical protein